MKHVSIVALVAICLLMGGLFVHADAQGAPELSGKVVETMNSGGYTYVCIEKKGQKLWVAVPQTKIEVGKHVTFLPGVPMRNFTSKTLNRTFDVVYFSSGLAQ